MIGTILGIVWGVHFVVWIQLSLCHMFGVVFFFPRYESYHNHTPQIIFMLWQWCTYIICLCTFHLLEFFITAIYNPTQATSDSYLVNHSITYTTAAILSWIEFWIRFICVLRQTPLPVVDSFSLPSSISYVGLAILVCAQGIRSLAMATAGESFNHLIQTTKKQNHILITHGIYGIFRHPSYVGFFYWSISTQLILGNVLHVFLYSLASWTFFNRRIQYEEESLCQFFPETYPQYVAQTYIGIPLIKSQRHHIAAIPVSKSTMSSNYDRPVTIEKLD